MERTVLGLSEKVKIQGKEVEVRIDTGAVISSLCTSLAEELQLTQPIKHMIIRSSNGQQRRPVVEAEIEIRNKRFMAHFTIADRTKLQYRALLGLNVLKTNGFLIDPTT